MDSIIEKLKYDMELHNLTKNTQKHYVCYVRKFEQHFEKSAIHLGIDEIKSFLYYLRYEKKLKVSTVNCYRNGIRYLYEVTIGKGWDERRIPHLKYYKSAPSVLSKKEVLTLIDAIDKLKYKAMLCTIYGSGLRIGELVALKVKDIDSERMQIYVREGKYGSSRYTILSQKSLEILREYIKEYFYKCGKKPYPDSWLFQGELPGEHITSRAIQHSLKRAERKAKISKNITVHTLRHSFATHLLDAGTNLFHIKELLGHKSIRSTCVYLHMTDMRGSGIKSPFDYIKEEDQ